MCQWLAGLFIHWAQKGQTQWSAMICKQWAAIQVMDQPIVVESIDTLSM